MPANPPKKAQGDVARTARRQEIARRLVAQEKPAEVAAALGVTRKTIYNELQEPETQELIRAWMRPYHAAAKRLIPRALAAVNTGLKPSQKMSDRLAAVKTLGTILGWAEGRMVDGDTSSQPRKFVGSMEELLVLYRRVTSETSELPPAPPQAQ